MATQEKNRQNNLSDCLPFVGSFLLNMCYIIGLKALENYSDQFWSHKISVLLCEGPKPQNSVISGISAPGNPYLWI